MESSMLDVMTSDNPYQIVHVKFTATQAFWFRCLGLNQRK